MGIGQQTKWRCNSCSAEFQGSEVTQATQRFEKAIDKPSYSRKLFCVNCKNYGSRQFSMQLPETSSGSDKPNIEGAGSW